MVSPGQDGVEGCWPCTEQMQRFKQSDFGGDIAFVMQEPVWGIKYKYTQ